MSDQLRMDGFPENEEAAAPPPPLPAARARARKDDPWTSWAAAQSLGELRARQAAVAACFDADGPMTQETLATNYQDHAASRGYPAQTDQSIRSRCAELQALGIIAESGLYGLTVNGRKARVLMLARDRR